MNEPVIEARGLGFAYDKTSVLKDVELSVVQGEIYGLVGADGAGKSTLLGLAVGQLRPRTGEVRVLGKDAADPSLRTEIAYMPQGFGLYQDLSVEENLVFFADLHGLQREAAAARIADLLSRTGLAGFETRRAGNLSGGMMQKLALASALVAQPRVMFLDEPTTGVDPVSRRAFWRLLEAVRTEGIAILYATANMDEAERCDRVGVLEQGRLSRQGTPLELSRSEDVVLLSVSGPNARTFRHRLRELPGVQLVFPVGLQLNVWMDAGRSLDDFQRDLASVAPELQARRQEATLHDARLRDLALAEGDHG